MDSTVATAAETSSAPKKEVELNQNEGQGGVALTRARRGSCFIFHLERLGRSEPVNAVRAASAPHFAPGSRVILVAGEPQESDAEVTHGASFTFLRKLHWPRVYERHATNGRFPAKKVDIELSDVREWSSIADVECTTEAELTDAQLVVAVTLTTDENEKDDNDIEGTACPGDCPPELAPVCGNDGITYRNLCQLRRKSCIGGAAIRVSHVGQCEEETAADPCESLECGPWSRCQVSGGGATCRCLSCPPPPPPGSGSGSGSHVCGSDGRDYGSECELHAAACRLGDTQLALRHHGKCDVCQGHKCPVHSTCYPDDQGMPQCRCLDTCRDAVKSPVCGSDGTTYESACRLRMTSCEKQMIIVVTYKGPCDPCRGVVCAEPGAVCRAGVCACRDDCPRDAPAERVCGSDGRTYRSECRLHLASCRRPRGRSPITVAFYGDCRAADEETPVVALTSTTASSVSPTPLSTLPGDYDADGVQKVSKSTRHLALAEAVAGAAGAVSHHQYVLPDAGAGLTSASLYRGLSDHPDTEPLYSAVYRPTPATLSSLLGGACSSDGDCSVAGSRCQENTCRCGPDRTPSHDRQHCLAYQIPSFDGQAYIEMKRLKAHNKLNIEIEFITYANDGLLLYNQQKEDGTGDFVSLAIVQGHVEFRYNLGNGAVALTSAERVTLGRVHVARARRYHRDGLLRLDDGPEVVGQSQGPLRALNLELSAYLGAVPTNHSR
ncbi:agrin-like [Schistocerca gregaria]|uniref:agrin-like n=1 Tax=Schistocerca gregaria TaxID=7010 RepID=UPI00211EF624|nr:agrin-like [Schistocerca gregaria]